MNVQYPIISENYPSVHQGKVRDIYEISNELLLMIASDRLSAFDRILTDIPAKGQMLDAITWFWISQTADIVPHAYLRAVGPGASLVRRANMLPIEVVVRGYLCGSGWREYSKLGTVSGVELSAGLHEFDRLSTPVITPSTKSPVGVHDEPISEEEIVFKELLSLELLENVKRVALKLFLRGSTECEKRGLILADTKYEFGMIGDELYLTDEVHTPDSSRFWELSTYKQHHDDGLMPVMKDKEVIRRWLMQQGYMGDGVPPKFTEEFLLKCAELYEQVTKIFIPDFKVQSLDEQKLLHAIKAFH